MDSYIPTKRLLKKPIEKRITGNLLYNVSNMVRKMIGRLTIHGKQYAGSMTYVKRKDAAIAAFDLFGIPTDWHWIGWLGQRT